MVYLVLHDCSHNLKLAEFAALLRAQQKSAVFKLFYDYTYRSDEAEALRNADTVNIFVFGSYCPTQRHMMVNNGDKVSMLDCIGYALNQIPDMINKKIEYTICLKPSTECTQYLREYVPLGIDNRVLMLSHTHIMCTDDEDYANNIDSLCEKLKQQQQQQQQHPRMDTDLLDTYLNDEEYRRPNRLTYQDNEEYRHPNRLTYQVDEEYGRPNRLMNDDHPLTSIRHTHRGLRRAPEFDPISFPTRKKFRH